MLAALAVFTCIIKTQFKWMDGWITNGWMVIAFIFTCTVNNLTFDYAIWLYCVCMDLESILFARHTHQRRFEEPVHLQSVIQPEHTETETIKCTDVVYSVYLYTYTLCNALSWQCCQCCTGAYGPVTQVQWCPSALVDMAVNCRGSCKSYEIMVLWQAGINHLNLLLRWLTV